MISISAAVAVALIVCCATAVAPAAAQIANVSDIKPWNAETTIVLHGQAAHVCVRSSDTIEPRRPCMKIRYPYQFAGSWNSEQYHCAKYFYICDTVRSEIRLMQCGNRFCQGDFSGDQCRTTANCVLRETYKPTTSDWALGHVDIDKLVKWDGQLYSIDMWQRRERWKEYAEGENDNAHFCSNPNGDSNAPRTIEVLPAGNLVCQKTNVWSRNVMCGTKTDPLADPTELFYKDDKDCGGVEQKKTFGGNNTCFCNQDNCQGEYRRGPRWLCSNKDSGSEFYAFIMDTKQSAGAVASGLVLVVIVVLVAVMF